MNELSKRLRYYAQRGTGVGPEELLVYAAALEQAQIKVAHQLEMQNALVLLRDEYAKRIRELEAALIEWDRGHIRCLALPDRMRRGWSENPAR